jgi:hypothetical protein
LGPHYGFLRRLKESAEVRSYCGLLADDRGSFQVSGEGLSVFTELGIDMEIGLVFLGPADSVLISEELEPMDTRGAEAPEPRPEGCRTHSEVAFEVLGVGLDLTGISSHLGLESSKTHRLGEADRSGNAYATDSWCLVAPLPPRDALDAHFKWLGMALLGHSDFLRSLKGKGELLIRADFRTESDTGGLSISPEGLKVSTQLDVPMEFNAVLI